MSDPLEHMTTPQKPKSQNHFGYRKVTDEMKTALVAEVFSSVAERYDLMNDVMSWGIHRLWKRELIRSIKARPGMSIIDVGCGTGDIPLSILNNCSCSITSCDVNTQMISIGRDKAINAGLLSSVNWVCGNAEDLPLTEQFADVYVTAFCIRNVTEREAALREAYRVLKPGGHFLCLEFSEVVLPILRKIYLVYSFQVLPLLGKLIADDREAYQYLVESIQNFPSQEQFSKELLESGLRQVNYRNLSGGIVAIHSAWRI